MTTIGIETNVLRFPTRRAGAAPRPRLRITRRGRAVLAVLIAVPLAFMGVAVGLSGQTAAASSTAARPHYVTVASGESLWTIAHRINPSADPRDIVADLEDANAIASGTVYPGERLLVPTADLP